MAVETVLVVILSVGFFILLVLSIALVVILISVLRQVQRLSRKVEATTENLSESLKFIGKKLGPAAVSALLAAGARKFSQRKKKEN